MYSDLDEVSNQPNMKMATKANLKAVLDGRPGNPALWDEIDPIHQVQVAGPDRLRHGRRAHRVNGQPSKRAVPRKNSYIGEERIGVCSVPFMGPKEISALMTALSSADWC